MENSNERHYESIKKALEGVGLKVDKIQKKGKKTVITIFRDEIYNVMLNPLEQEKKDETSELKIEGVF